MTQLPESSNAPETPSVATEHPAGTSGETGGSNGSAPAGGAGGAAISADLAAEINAAMDHSIAASTPHHAKPGKEELDAAHARMGDKPRIKGPRVVESGRERRPGVVVSVGPTDIFVEFGPKELGVVQRMQFKDDELPKVGETLEVVVGNFEAAESLFICSRPGLVQKADWELLEAGQIVEARVTGVNKGGLELEVAHHQAFMPASQVDVRRIDDLSVFVGEKLKCKVTRVDRTGRGNITLSRREIAGEERRAEMDKLKDSLKEGSVVEGTVKKIMQFGAFVDIGGMDGLLHISDLSHDRVKRVEDVLKEGDKVNVKILKLDWENRRHSLGLKQLTDDPWTSAIKDVVEGAIVTGKITKLAEFGCFVEVASGVEGLVHISELAWRRVEKTSDVVQPNNIVKVKVLKIDPVTKKISLSIKQASERPVEEAAPRGGSGGGGGRGGRGGRGDREEDTRKAEEILKETPALRRLREQAKAKTQGKLKSGLGAALGVGLRDLKL